VAVPDLQLVADVYNDAAGSGHPPTLAVERHFGTSWSTAGRWVRAARTAGRLDPVGWGSSPPAESEGRGGSARAGSGPAALQAAILRRAGGDLRIH
jgi:hypothetical protein